MTHRSSFLLRMIGRILRKEAKEAGVTAFVSKPLFMSELRAALMQQAVGTEKDAAVEKKHYNHAGKRVLLVEDNELNREIAAAIMEEAGLIVDSVEDGTRCRGKNGICRRIQI